MTYNAKALKACFNKERVLGRLSVYRGKRIASRGQTYDLCLTVTTGSEGCFDTCIQFSKCK